MDRKALVPAEDGVVCCEACCEGGERNPIVPSCLRLLWFLLGAVPVVDALGVDLVAVVVEVLLVE